jgi:hypothetical protein
VSFYVRKHVSFLKERIESGDMSCNPGLSKCQIAQEAHESQETGRTFENLIPAAF